MCSWCTRMKSISVFCVILYFRIGVSIPDQRDGRVQYHQHERPDKYQPNFRAPLDFQYNLSNSPARQNGEQKKTVEDSSQSHRSSASLPENVISKSQRLFPKYINSQQFGLHPSDTMATRTLVRNSKAGDQNGLHEGIGNEPHQPSAGISKLPIPNKMESEPQDGNFNSIYNKQIVLPHQTFQRKPKLSQVSILNPEENVRKLNLPRDKLQQAEILPSILPTVSLPSDYQNDNVLNWKKKELEMQQTSLLQRPSLAQSIKTGEKTKLELQGLSPGNIASLLSTISLQNLSKQQLPSVLLKNSENSDKASETAQSVRASYQNPSAEILYKMNQAQPYRISDEQISHTPLDSHNVQNIFNVHKLLDLHASAPREKRYILVHPDGRVEHVNNLEKVATHFPHYVSVKSSDLKKYANGHTNFLPTSLVRTLVKTKPTPLQFTNVMKPPTVPLKRKMNDDVFTKSLTSKLITATDTKSNILNGSAVHFIKPNTSYVFETDSVKKNTTETNQNISLQDQKTTLPSKIGKDFRTSEIQHSSITKPKSFAGNITVKSLNETVLNISTLQTQTHITKSVLKELSIDRSSNQTLDGEDMSLDNSKIIPTNIQENNNSISNDSLTLNEPKNLDISYQANIENFSESSNLTTNADQDSSVTLRTFSSLSSEEFANKSGFWFQADEDFLDRLVNDPENVFYFLFLPPVPRAERETTRTIYPNGTIVEEVIEKINNEDHPNQAPNKIEEKDENN